MCRWAGQNVMCFQEQKTQRFTVQAFMFLSTPVPVWACKTLFLWQERPHFLRLMWIRGTEGNAPAVRLSNAPVNNISALQTNIWEQALRKLIWLHRTCNINNIITCFISLKLCTCTFIFINVTSVKKQKKNKTLYIQLQLKYNCNL